MKKKIFLLSASAVFIAVMTIGVYAATKTINPEQTLILKNIEALSQTEATCNFGSVYKDSYTNTLHCSGSGNLCCTM